ncbi:hypothetical protein [Curtobacterium sp. MCBD17_028]|uniref:hypothetical protein n=1 Tax=Curtobacterium sp. MCBD17_028 TaxID=2175670 RepID=UPI000DA86E80|nr:hypothetical protein [Curtobacterium sp. MCBD17_028]PZE23914.1 hypothetical protein DEI86_13830 [Curtobacterium sp. MCBD17_028]
MTSTNDTDRRPDWEHTPAPGVDQRPAPDPMPRGPGGERRGGVPGWSEVPSVRVPPVMLPPTSVRSSRRWFWPAVVAAVAVVALFVGGVGGYVIGHRSSGTTTQQFPSGGTGGYGSPGGGTGELSLIHI